MSSFLIRYVGKYLDQYGSRPVAFTGAVLLGIVLIGFSKVDRAVEILRWLLPTKMEIPAITLMMMFAFLLLRFFGQGTMTLTSRTMLMRWFSRLRGRINALLGIAVALMFSSSPLFFNYLINLYGWRGAWLVMGIFIFIIASSVILIFYRRDPEASGLNPDGDSNQERENTNNFAGVEVDWTLKEARQVYTFWIFSIGLAMFSLILTAITFHIVSIFETCGYSRSDAISVFFPGAVIAVIIEICAGFMVDSKLFRDRLHFLLIALLLTLAISCAGIFLLPSSSYGKYLIIAGNGGACGLFGSLSAVVWARYFGRKNLGAITGHNMSFLVLFSALGPPIFAGSFSLFGGYAESAVVCAILCVIMIILAVKAIRPEKVQDSCFSSR